MAAQLEIYKLFYNSIENPTLLDFLLYYGHKHNINYRLQNFLYRLKYGRNYSTKCIDTIQLKAPIKVETDNGQMNTITHVHLTKPFTIYTLYLENGLELQGADEHFVYSSCNYIETWKHIKDLTLNDYIKTKFGWSKVKQINIENHKEYMFDISIKENEHNYLSNNILSHNTTTVCCYFTWFLIFHDDKTSFVSANKGSTGKEIISKIKDVLEGLPFFMKPGILNLSETRIKFENGSSLKTAAASKSPATGDSLQLLYIDEAALIPAHIIDEYWASIQPTMSSFRGNQIIFSSTPRGKGNLFYNIYTKAIPWDSPARKDPANKNKFVSSRVDWWEVPGRDEEWEKQQRDELGDEKFNREFGLSFESSTTRLINAWTINFMNKIKKHFVSRPLYNVPNDICEKIIWHPDFDPSSLSLYDLMYNIFLFVIDLAQGIEAGVAGKEDADYNIIHIYRIELMSPRKIEENRDWQHPIDIRNVIQYKEIGIYADNFKDEEMCAEACKYLAFNVFKTGYSDGVNNIDNVRILYEVNFNGKNWYNKFKAHPGFYDQIIIKTQNGVDKNGKPVLMNGFRTKNGSKGKKYYCDLGEKMLRQRQIIVSQYDSNINLSTIYQLENFGKDKKGNYSGAACHDDLSITVFFVSIAGEQEYFRIWVEEWLENMILTPQVQIIRQMLEIYVETEPEITDQEFTGFYNMASAGFGKITKQSNSYSSLMNGNNTNNYGLQQPRYGNRQPRYNGMPYQPQRNIAAMSRFVKFK